MSTRKLNPTDYASVLEAAEAALAEETGVDNRNHARACAVVSDALMKEVERLVLAQPERYDSQQDLRVYIAQLENIEALVRNARARLVDADMAMGRR